MDLHPEVYTSGETRARHSNARADGVFCAAALQKSGSSGSTVLANSRTQMCISRSAIVSPSADSGVAPRRVGEINAGAEGSLSLGGEDGHAGLRSLADRGEDFREL